MQRKLEFNIHIRRPISVVYGHLANPKNFIGLQPLLSSISSLQEIHVNNKHGYKYETVETFRIGSIPVLNNKIHVQTVLTDPGREIDSVVQSKPNIRLDVHYQFTSLGEETNVIEQMLVSVPIWVSTYVIRTAQQVQKQTLANLKQRLEATGGIS